ncbi:conserved protein of unknown function [Tenacibaculum sp. 190130A14a]|uniref:Uncharacterized protein n=1 Tax=Tenacibaculum polynesiense TaxID=3137857 RepID=A0ABM9PFI7_9FLAO
MRIIVAVFSFLVFCSFHKVEETDTKNKDSRIEIIGSSISLINDTKQKVSIYTGSGFVTLNKGSKTSISCKVGKEVRWASNGRKGKIIFKIESKHCGKTLKLSKF